jgi:hypothetical protein
MFVKGSHRMSDQNLLFIALTCFRRHFKLLVPAAFAVVSTQFQGGLMSGRRPVVKIVAESL